MRANVLFHDIHFKSVLFRVHLRIRHSQGLRRLIFLVFDVSLHSSVWTWWKAVLYGRKLDGAGLCAVHLSAPCGSGMLRNVRTITHIASISLLEKMISLRNIHWMLFRRTQNGSSMAGVPNSDPWDLENSCSMASLWKPPFETFKFKRVLFSCFVLVATWN